VQKDTFQILVEQQWGRKKMYFLTDSRCITEMVREGQGCY